MSYARCKTCEWFGNLAHHDCPPIHLVWRHNAGETEADAVSVRGWTPCEAAERWAEEDDAHGDYDLLKGTEEVVSVKDPNGVVTRWAVIGESVPSYSAREVVL